MHDIKYFFLNKNNQTIQRGQKKFQEGTDYRKYYLKTLFFKITVQFNLNGSDLDDGG
jgi:hypothetical protein